MLKIVKENGKVKGFTCEGTIVHVFTYEFGTLRARKGTNRPLWAYYDLNHLLPSLIFGKVCCFLRLEHVLDEAGVRLVITGLPVQG